MIYDFTRSLLHGIKRRITTARISEKVSAAAVGVDAVDELLAVKFSTGLVSCS
jgi:hypothetical protein